MTARSWSGASYPNSGGELVPARAPQSKLTSAQLAILLVVAGTAGRIALAKIANVETVLAAAMLAGALLRGWYAAFVPIAIMGFSDAVLYASGIGGALGFSAILGLSAFTWSGFLLVALVGTRIDRSKILFTVRSIAVLTTVSIPATIAYDLWTDIGEWLFIAAPHGIGLPQVLAAQVPFTLIHLASSLVFVPLFGTIFTWLHMHELPRVAPEPAMSDERASSE